MILVRHLDGYSVGYSYTPYLECGELVALLLEASDDLAHQVALHAVRLDHDVGALHGAAHATGIIIMHADTCQINVKQKSCRYILPAGLYRHAGTHGTTRMMHTHGHMSQADNVFLYECKQDQERLRAARA